MNSYKNLLFVFYPLMVSQELKSKAKLAAKYKIAATRNDVLKKVREELDGMNLDVPFLTLIKAYQRQTEQQKIVQTDEITVNDIDINKSALKSETAEGKCSTSLVDNTEIKTNSIEPSSDTSESDEINKSFLEHVTKRVKKYIKNRGNKKTRKEKINTEEIVEKIIKTKIEENEEEEKKKKIKQEKKREEKMPPKKTAKKLVKKDAKPSKKTAKKSKKTIKKPKKTLLYSSETSTDSEAGILNLVASDSIEEPSRNAKKLETSNSGDKAVLPHSSTDQPSIVVVEVPSGSKIKKTPKKAEEQKTKKYNKVARKSVKIPNRINTKVRESVKEEDNNETVASENMSFFKF
ncbi:hypothetical protein NUSPORA_01900 [Nucleospora cyclopteri]